MSETRPGVIVHTDSVSYSPIPLGNIDRDVWAVKVEWTGYDDDGEERYAVRNMSRCLSRSGEWVQEPTPSSRTDEWLAKHRFSRHEAAETASEVCHSVKWNGRTADEIVRRS